MSERHQHSSNPSTIALERSRECGMVTGSETFDELIYLLVAGILTGRIRNFSEVEPSRVLLKIIVSENGRTRDEQLFQCDTRQFSYVLEIVETIARDSQTKRVKLKAVKNALLGIAQTVAINLGSTVARNRSERHS